MKIFTKRLIITGLICLVIGFVLGLLVIYPQIRKINNIKDSAGIFNKISTAKIMSSFAVYGKVSGISGRTITLNNSSDLQIPVSQNAKITSLVMDPKNISSSNLNVDFGYIKVGDEISITLQLLSDGTVQGISVMVIPSAGSVKNHS